MGIFETPVIASEDDIKNIKPEDLKGFGNKFDGKWYFVVFADTEDKRIVCAMSVHKSYKKAMAKAMKDAIERVS